MATDALTKNWLIEDYLYGLDLTDDYGNPFPDRQFDDAIAKAVEEINGLIEFQVGKAVRRATVDFIGGRDARRWFGFRFPWLPLWEIRKVQFKFGTQTMFDIPQDWVLTAPSEVEGGPIMDARVHLVPTMGTLEGMQHYLIVSTLWSQMFTSGMGSYMPRYLYVEGLCGADPEEIPADILNFIGMRASLLALNIAGDLLVGAGVASKSLSMDGVSQNINTTSSATNAGYGARILQYWKDLRQILPALQRKYNGIRAVGA